MQSKQEQADNLTVPPCHCFFETRRDSTGLWVHGQNRVQGRVGGGGVLLLMAGCGLLHATGVLGAAGRHGVVQVLHLPLTKSKDAIIFFRPYQACVGWNYD